MKDITANEGVSEDVEQAMRVSEVLKRRAAALLEIKFASLARAGLPIAAAYVNNPPTPRIQWAKRS